VYSLINDGLPADHTDLTETGPIELSDLVDDDLYALDLIPNFRTAFDAAESTAIQTAITNQADFGIGYDIEANSNQGAWYVIDSPAPSGTEDFPSPFNASDPASWLIFCSYDAVDNVWTFRTRGKRYIFESKEDVRFFFDPTNQAIDVQTGLALSDEIVILRTNTLTNPASIGSDAALVNPVELALTNLVLYEDGYKDPRKIEVVPLDTNADGVPDDPLELASLIDNGGDPRDVYFQRFTDFDGYEYFRLWEAGRYNLDTAIMSVDVSGTDPLVSGTGGSPDPQTNLNNVDLILTTNDPTATGASSILDAILNPAAGTTEDAVVAFDGMIFFDANPTVRQFYIFNQLTTTTGEIVQTTDYEAKIGRSFELDTTSGNNVANPFYFKWKHYAPRSNRIDPSISNVIDTILLTNSYYSDVITWKGSNDITAPFPDAPTTEDLRTQFLELNDYKMLSDQIIYKPGKFKLLFGNGADDELTAKFKVVKVPGTTVTDNEVKSEVISAIDEYFDISNWDFGESFFYTELSAYIHQKLAKIVASIVIVPQKDDSVFGNLFQVKGETDELFLSTATVADVEIVRNLTDTNLRVGAST